VQFECSKWCISKVNINFPASLVHREALFRSTFFLLATLRSLASWWSTSPLPFPSLKFQSCYFSPCQLTGTFILFIFYYLWIYFFMSPAFISISFFIFCQLYYLFPLRLGCHFVLTKGLPWTTLSLFLSCLLYWHLLICLDDGASSFLWNIITCLQDFMASM